MVDENYTGPGWIGGGNGATSLSETGEGWFYDLFNWFGALGDVTGSSGSPLNFFTYISSFDNAVGEVSWNYRWLPDSPGGSEPLVVAGVGPRQDGSSMRDGPCAFAIDANQLYPGRWVNPGRCFYICLLYGCGPGKLEVTVQDDNGVYPAVLTLDFADQGGDMTYPSVYADINTDGPGPATAFWTEFRNSYEIP